MDGKITVKLYDLRDRIDEIAKYLTQSSTHMGKATITTVVTEAVRMFVEDYGRNEAFRAWKQQQKAGKPNDRSSPERGGRG